MGSKGNKANKRRGRGRPARDPQIEGATAPLAAVPEELDAAGDVAALLAGPTANDLAEAEGGELADPGADDFGNPQWFMDGQATDEEEVGMLMSDWSMYAQASLSGGADSPEEAALDADVLMHEQLKRHALMARNMVDPGTDPDPAQ